MPELGRHDRWGARADVRLRRMWMSGLTLDVMALRLGRSQQAVFYRARHLGLPRGPLPGWESLLAASLRTGYDESQLKVIFKWAGVRMVPRRCLGRPGHRRKYRWVMVEREDVDAAVLDWMARDSTVPAALARAA